MTYEEQEAGLREYARNCGEIQNPAVLQVLGVIHIFLCSLVLILELTFGDGFNSPTSLLFHRYHEKVREILFDSLPLMEKFRRVQWQPWPNPRD